MKHREALVAALNAKACQASRADVLAAFLEHRVPAGAVHNVQEALSSEMAQAYLTGQNDQRKVKTSAIRWDQAGMRNT